MSGPGEDSNYPLLRSALRAAHDASPKAQLVVVPGDFLAHQFHARYSACFPDAKDGEFTRFAANTVAFVTMEIAREFAGAQIVPALGNNDTDRGDYSMATEEMLRQIAATWQPMVNGKHSAGLADFIFFPGGGYYTALLTGWKHLRMVVLNSVAWSPSFTDAGASKTTVGDSELEWLQAVLSAADKAGDKVVVVGHIPPGLDAYATRNTGGSRIVSMYMECGEQGASANCRDYGHAVPNMLQRFSSTIALGIFGHTHQNEFRVAGEAKASVPIQIVPSISPIFRNNPGFLVVAADQKFMWKDYTAWYLPSIKGSGQEAGKWQMAYEFDKEYAQASWDAVALRNLVKKLGDNTAVRREFFLWMASGNPQAEVPVRWQEPYICGLTHMTPEAVLPCVATDQTGIPLP
jgi:sphingomyelin phosphodiesterase acid-like 3